MLVSLRCKRQHGIKSSDPINHGFIYSPIYLKCFLLIVYFQVCDCRSVWLWALCLLSNKTTNKSTNFFVLLCKQLYWLLTVWKCARERVLEIKRGHCWHGFHKIISDKLVILIDSVMLGHDHPPFVRVCSSITYNMVKLSRTQNIACDIHAVVSEVPCLFYVEMLKKWNKSCFITVLIIFWVHTFPQATFTITQRHFTALC